MSEKEKELKDQEELKELSEQDHKTKKEKKKKESLEDKLELIQEELQNVKDKYLRVLAEMDNYKKRTSEDLKRERKYASMSVAEKLIDAIEVFDQALLIETDDPNFKNFLYGFKMIKDMIYSPLVEEGVSVIETKIGDVFNPNTEHAFDSIEDETLPNNTITKIVKKGYMFKDRLLRPAMVIINIISKDEIEELSDSENIDSNNQNVA
ncbi:MAG: nucleotide exchange factor GrpE [Firmicutes bacterium]|nr:nucleotide exchange factor GrpE [Bacillota bacterium]